MEHFNSVRNCENCRTRFNQRVSQKRKRTLIGQESILNAINETRRNKNLPLLNYSSVICHGCCRKYEYKAETSCSTSGNDGLQHEEGSEEESSGDEQAMSVSDSSGESDIRETLTDTHEDPMPCSSAQMQRNRLQTSNCGRCALQFSLNPRVRIRPLFDDNPVLPFLNGIRIGLKKDPMPPGTVLCNSCYRVLYNTYNSLTTRRSKAPEMAYENPENMHLPESDERIDEEDSESEHSRNTSAVSDSSSSTDYDAIASPPKKVMATRYDHVILSLKSIHRNRRGCFICSNKSSWCRVKLQSRMQVWFDYQIFLGKDLRACRIHTDKATNLFTEQSIRIITQLQKSNTTSLRAKDLERFIMEVSSYADQNDKIGRLSFVGTAKYTENDYNEFFGLEKRHFDELSRLCDPYLRNSKSRCSKDALAIFLMKIRTNVSQRLLAAAFHVSQQSVSFAIKTVRKLLMEHFVPKYLGYNHLTREEYILEHTTESSKIITGASERQAIVVVDGTYLYIQKSRNYKTQRLTYSPHKFRNLLKAMMLVSTTGHILHVDGPYIANGSNNDANIMKTITTDMNGFRNFFNAGDFIIEDRGFRDCNTLLSSLGYSVKMPHFLGGKRNQHTTLEANESRLVTKIRWIVELVNGRLKNVFRFFRDVISNSYVKNNAIWEFFLISCAILNAYRPAIKVDTAEDTEFAQEMLERVDMHNLLQLRLVEANLIRKTIQWKKVELESLTDVPRLTLSDLRKITLGVYQIKQAPSYMADENDEGDYDIFWHDEVGFSAIRFKIQSRFRSSKQHSLWVGINPEQDGVRGITGWYCLCENGARIVGCCAHIAAIIWYFGYARYLPKVCIPNILSHARDASKFQYDGEAIDIGEDLDIFSSEDET